MGSNASLRPSPWHRFLLPSLSNLTSCLAWLLPPSKLLVSPPCVACCPACCAPAVSLPTDPFCSSSLCLCGCGLKFFFFFFFFFLSCSKMSCCPHSGTRTVSNPSPCFSTLTHPPKQTNLHHLAYCSTAFQPQKWSWKMLELCIWMKGDCLHKQSVFFLHSVNTPQFL